MKINVYIWVCRRFNYNFRKSTCKVIFNEVKLPIELKTLRVNCQYHDWVSMQFQTDLRLNSKHMIFCLFE